VLAQFGAVRRDILKTTRTIAAALGTAALGLAAGCGSSSTSTPPPSSAAGSPVATAAGSSAAAAPAFSCTSISTDLQTVLSDLKSSDAAEQEAWVTNGHSGDLQVLINDTNGATGSSQLDQDASTFNSDASGYLADQSPYLNTDWETEYRQVRLDINALATDCGMSPVPAPPGTS
jgi:hypothetical protein